MTSNNPFFKSKSFNKPQTVEVDEQGNRSVLIDYNETMTVSGTINKSLIMLLFNVNGKKPIPFSCEKRIGLKKLSFNYF